MASFVFKVHRIQSGSTLSLFCYKQIICFWEGWVRLKTGRKCKLIFFYSSNNLAYFWSAKHKQPNLYFYVSCLDWSCGLSIETCKPELCPDCPELQQGSSQLKRSKNWWKFLVLADSRCQVCWMLWDWNIIFQILSFAMISYFLLSQSFF